MASVKKKNRKHGIIDSLAPELKDTVEQMLLTNATYVDIVEYLGGNGVKISTSSVCRYAEGFHANAQMLHMAQENFRMMMDQLDKYPELDTTKAIEMLANHNVLNALANTSEDRWQEIDPDKLLRNTSALIRAAAYKKRVDVQNQSDFEAGFESAKTLAFSALAKEKPELYQQVAEFLNEKKKEGGA